MTEALYLKDCYLKEFDAIIENVKDEKYIILDKTAFYPVSGGQPHDTGNIVCNDQEYNIVFVGKFDGKISHEIDKEGLKEGDKVRCIINWNRRYKLMRMHTAAHILDSVIHNESGAMFTGNQLGEDKIFVELYRAAQKRVKRRDLHLALLQDKSLKQEIYRYKQNIEFRLKRYKFPSQWSGFNLEDETITQELCDKINEAGREIAKSISPEDMDALLGNCSDGK